MRNRGLYGPFHFDVRVDVCEHTAPIDYGVRPYVALTAERMYESGRVVLPLMLIRC